MVRTVLTLIYLFLLCDTVRNVGGFDDVYEGFDSELIVREVCGGGDDESEFFDILDSIVGVEMLVLAFSFYQNVCQLYLTR